jgi:hypothetical protein
MERLEAKNARVEHSILLQTRVSALQRLSLKSLRGKEAQTNKFLILILIFLFNHFGQFERGRETRIRITMTIKKPWSGPFSTLVVGSTRLAQRSNAEALENLMHQVPVLRSRNGNGFQVFGFRECLEHGRHLDAFRSGADDDGDTFHGFSSILDRRTTLTNSLTALPQLKMIQGDDDQ